MISPLNTILNSMLSSLFTLVGGLFMCLYTSWRLSILAFTSIFPVVYIMNVYAQWSRGLNRQIWAALGDANAVATESISNIRIVRAFGRETNEILKFGQSVGLALKKGVRDAIAGSRRLRDHELHRPGSRFSFLVMEVQHCAGQYAQTHRGKTDHISAVLAAYQ